MLPYRENRRVYMMIPILIMVIAASLMLSFPLNMVQCMVASLSLGTKLAIVLLED